MKLDKYVDFISPKHHTNTKKRSQTVTNRLLKKSLKSHIYLWNPALGAKETHHAGWHKWNPLESLIKDKGYQNQDNVFVEHTTQIIQGAIHSIV